MSKTMSFVGSIAANSTNPSIFAGQLHEFCAGNSVINLRMTGSAAGLRASVLVGNETFAQDQEISSANRYPVVPDDSFVQAAGLAGERIVVSIRNATAGALTAQVVAEIIAA